MMSAGCDAAAVTSAELTAAPGSAENRSPGQIAPLAAGHPEPVVARDGRADRSTARFSRICGGATHCRAIRIELRSEGVGAPGWGGDAHPKDTPRVQHALADLVPGLPDVVEWNGPA